MARKEIKAHEKSLERGIGNWYKFHAEMEDEFKRILDEATPDENRISAIPLKETEGFYGLPGYKDNVVLKNAIKCEDIAGDNDDYYIETDFVKLNPKGELEVIGHVKLDFEELSDAIILSDVMHSLYSWEYENFGDE